MTQIKKGYKQTDIGIIPEDWEVNVFGKIFKYLSTATYSRAEEVEADGILYIHYGDIHTKWNHFVDFDKDVLPKIPHSKIKNYSLIQSGDLIIADASEDYTGLCKSVEVKNNSKQIAISGLHTISVRDIKNVFKNGYKGYLLQSIGVKEQLERLATGIKVYGVSKQNLKTVLLAVPTKKEQQAISQTLSDVDSLIEALDKKIAKKRAIKEGAMQQLLTGKKRLAGFTEPWVEKKMEDIGLVVTGSTPSRNVNDYWGEEFVWISAVDFRSKYINDSKEKLTKLGKQICRVIPKNSVLVTCIASIGLNAIAKVECATNQQINSLICNLNNDCEFMYYQISTSKKRLLELAGQTAVPIITKNEFENFTLIVPKSLKEQQAIAQILTDMDDEIEQLDKERQKYTALKQGAMQQLLTGQIRLVNAALQTQNIVEIKAISVDAHVIGGHIVNMLHTSNGWGRTKLQKTMHLVDYCCQIDFGGEYIRNIAGPDNQQLMNYINFKFEQFGHVRIELKNDRSSGRKHYNYIPTHKITEVEQAFERYPTEKQKTINDLLNKIKKMDLARAEIVSTLYAVWNNRIIRKQPINDDLLLTDFYDWSEHKSDYSRDLVLRGLNYMRQDGIIPIGWGKYIDKKENKTI